MSRAISQPGPADLSVCLSKMDRGRVITRTVRMEPNGAFEGYAGPLVDAVELFEALGLGYALAGGLAAMLYGRARFTEDVDFVLASGHEQVLAANRQRMEHYRFKPDCTFMLYHQSGVEIDIWKDEHADEIVSRARSMEWRGRSVQVADPHDLIAMKLRADRLTDHSDVAAILRQTPIDDDRIKSLVSPRQFRRYQFIRRRKDSAR